MGDDSKRLDESLSIDALRKGLSGTANTRPAVDRLEISPSGQVQPKSSQPGPTESAVSAAAPEPVERAKR